MKKGVFWRSWRFKIQDLLHLFDPDSDKKANFKRSWPFTCGNRLSEPERVQPFVLQHVGSADDPLHECVTDERPDGEVRHVYVEGVTPIKSSKVSQRMNR